MFPHEAFPDTPFFPHELLSCRILPHIHILRSVTAQHKKPLLKVRNHPKKKFQEYKTVIQERVKDLEEENINIRKLSKKEQQDLNNLRVIEEYLTRVLDEHQKILNSHFDLKILYTEELERLSQARLIQRFSMRRDLYE